MFDLFFNNTNNTIKKDGINYIFSDIKINEFFVNKLTFYSLINI